MLCTPPCSCFICTECCWFNHKPYIKKELDLHAGTDGDLKEDCKVIVVVVHTNRLPVNFLPFISYFIYTLKVTRINAVLKQWINNFAWDLENGDTDQLQSQKSFVEDCKFPRPGLNQVFVVKNWGWGNKAFGFVYCIHPLLLLVCSPDQSYIRGFVYNAIVMECKIE